MPGANNFESTVSARAVGTADVRAQADAMLKLAESIDGLGQKATKINEHPGLSAFAEKIKAGIENPMQAAGQAAEDLLKTMGPVGVGITAGAGIFTAAATGIFELAKSVGEVGTQFRDMELRTGMSAKEIAGIRSDSMPAGAGRSA